jgi:nucleotide-binding universal stress UspA family protein
MRQQYHDMEASEVHLINVQRPVSGDVASFIEAKSLDEYHQERSELALAPARDALVAAGVKPHEHTRVGQPGPLIAEIAAAEGCDLIVMGTRGLGSHTGALLGSVAQSVIEHATVPVLLAK